MNPKLIKLAIQKKNQTICIYILLQPTFQKAQLFLVKVFVAVVVYQIFLETIYICIVSESILCIKFKTCFIVNGE